MIAHVSIVEVDLEHGEVLADVSAFGMTRRFNFGIPTEGPHDLQFLTERAWAAVRSIRMQLPETPITARRTRRHG